MAAVIADQLNIPMDIVVPRKIGHPHNPEVAIGAITESGIPYWNESYMRYSNLTPDTLAVKQIVSDEINEAQRRLSLYRQSRPALQLNHKIAILVDDGIATGATMKAAILSAQAKHASKVIVAVPVGSPDTVHHIQSMCDDIVCLLIPHAFHAVGQYYRTFDQVDDSTVINIMKQQMSKSTQQLAATTNTISGQDELGQQSVRVA